MNLGKNLVDLATAPVRVGLAAAETGLDVANGAFRLAQRTLGQANSTARAGSGSVAHILGIDEAVERANRLARLMDKNQPLWPRADPGRADRPIALTGRRGGQTAPAGVLDRLTEDNGGLMRAIDSGGLVDQLLDEDGLATVAGRRRPRRSAARQGRAHRQADGQERAARAVGRRGRHPQSARPGLEALEPTIEALREAVIVLSQVVNPLSNIADRIPFPGRQPAPVAVDAGALAAGHRRRRVNPIGTRT